jgi:hypothetical protein
VPIAPQHTLQFLSLPHNPQSPPIIHQLPAPSLTRCCLSVHCLPTLLPPITHNTTRYFFRSDITHSMQVAQTNYSNKSASTSQHITTRFLYPTVKVKVILYRPPRAQRGSRGIALLILDLGARRGWVVTTTPRPLYPRKRPGTHCTGCWVGPRVGLDVCDKSRPTGIRSPDRPARSQSLYRLSYRPTYPTVRYLKCRRSNRVTSDC